VIPTINMGRFLLDAVASIDRQQIAVHEIIIVDSASRDETAEVIDALARHRNVRLLDVPACGPATARNAGMRAATGDVIAFLDADDIWPKGKLMLQLARLDGGPTVDFVCGFVAYFNELDRELLEPRASSRVHIQFLPHVGACLCRRSVFDSIGVFDESYLYAEDLDLFLRLLEAQIPMTILTAPMLYYRRHGDSMMTRDNPRKKTDFARAFAMSLMRRRQAGIPEALPTFESFYERVAESAL
jgi:glycosyltransferase involved in cell wall biosynthesis